MQFGPLEDLVTDERTIIGFNEYFKMLTYFSTDPRTFVLTTPVSSVSNLVFQFYGQNLLFCFGEGLDFFRGVGGVVTCNCLTSFHSANLGTSCVLQCRGRLG